jgi:hypothetical protein
MIRSDVHFVLLNPYFALKQQRIDLDDLYIATGYAARCYRYPCCWATASIAAVVTRSTGSEIACFASRRSIVFR